jgi:hypothetical protein
VSVMSSAQSIKSSSPAASWCSAYDKPCSMYTAAMKPAAEQNGSIWCARRCATAGGLGAIPCVLDVSVASEQLLLVGGFRRP